MGCFWFNINEKYRFSQRQKTFLQSNKNKKLYKKIIIQKKNIYYIIFSAVEICALTQVIHFFQFNALKIFNAGAGLGLATPLTTAVFVTISLKKKCIYSVAERLYEQINREMFQMHAQLHLCARRESNEHGNSTVLKARDLQLQKCSYALSVYKRSVFISARCS